MNTPTEENLFEITLSQQAGKNIVRAHQFVSFFAIAVTLAGLLGLTLLFLRIDDFMKADASGSVRQFLLLRVFPFFWLVSIVIGLINAFTYARYISLCKKGIETHQSELFNESFRWMLRNARIAAVLAAMNLLSALLELYIWINPQ